MDVYILTSDYDTAFRQWLAGVITAKPLAPSSDELYNTLAPSLNLIKAISDEVIYHPVTYTVLFGPAAAPELQANFMVIKNPEQVISDNDVQTGVISAINQFFAVGNCEGVISSLEISSEIKPFIGEIRHVSPAFLSIIGLR